MKLNIKTSSGSTFEVDVTPSITVAEFKDVLAETTKIPAVQQRLIYRGHVLKDVRTLESYAVEEGFTVHLVKGAAPAAATPESQTSTTQSTATPTQQTNATPNAGLGNFSPTPEMMEQMMANPLVEQMMSNPELLRQMMTSNPAVRQLIERNPELGHVLNDPQLLARSLQMARNPALLREAMRNTDRQLSNIEALPGGFDALRRMYTDVQAPLMDATLNPENNPLANNTANQQRQPTNDTQLNAPQHGAMPNPWQQQGAAAGGTTGAAGAGAGMGGFDAFGGMGGMGGFGGMGGMGGMGGLGGMGGMGNMDMNQLSQMMQNPMVQQMMQQMFSNPQMMQQMIDNNPMLSNMVNQNPQMRAMLTNPEFLRQMSNPQTLQAMMQMQQAMQSLQTNLGGFGAGNTAAGAGTDAAAGTGAAGAGAGAAAGGFGGLNPAMLAALGGLGGGFGAMPAATADTYREQIRQLNDMGFFDEQQNLEALQVTGGNVNAAVEYLLSNPPPARGNQ